MPQASAPAMSLGNRLDTQMVPEVLATVALGNWEQSESSMTMDIDEVGVEIQQNIVNNNCIIQSQGNIDVNSAITTNTVAMSNNIIAATAEALHQQATAAQQQQLAAAVDATRAEAERRHAEAMRQQQQGDSQQKHFYISSIAAEHAKQLAEAERAATAEVGRVLAASAAEISRNNVQRNSQQNSMQNEMAKMRKEMLSFNI